MQVFLFYFYFYFFPRIHYSLAVAKGYNCQVTFSVFKRQLPAIKTTLKLGRSPIDQRLNESILPPPPQPRPHATTTLISLRIYNVSDLLFATYLYALYCRVFLWTKLWYEAFTVLHYDTCVH